MKLFDRLRLFFLTRLHSSKWSEKDKAEIIELIESRNKELEIVRKEVFEGEGQAYRYYLDNGKIRCEGYYYSLGFDKRAGSRTKNSNPVHPAPTFLPYA